MTIAHHPSEETLVDYVAGALDEGNSLVIATHIARCTECQETVRDLRIIAGAVLEADPGAEEYAVLIAGFIGDDLQGGKPFLQVADAAVHFPQLFLAVDILGVLRSIALGGGGLQRRDHLLASLQPQGLQLRIQGFTALGRDVRTAPGLRRAPARRHIIDSC